MSNLIWFSDSYILMFRDLGNCTTCYLFHFKNTFITTETNTSVSNWACALSACQVNHLNQLLLHFYLLFFPILLGITKLNRKKKSHSITKYAIANLLCVVYDYFCFRTEKRDTKLLYLGILNSEDLRRTSILVRIWHNDKMKWAVPQFSSHPWNLCYSEVKTIWTQPQNEPSYYKNSDIYFGPPRI